MKIIGHIAGQAMTPKHNPIVSKMARRTTTLAKQAGGHPHLGNFFITGSEFGFGPEQSR